jgi:tryptophanyl-tRNA synthetase
VGIDPKRSAMFIQSEVPVIDELMFYFAMLLPFNRVMRNPTLKDELRDKGLGIVVCGYCFGRQRSGRLATQNNCCGVSHRDISGNGQPVLRRNLEQCLDSNSG